MIYTHQDFGRELLAEIDKDYDTIRLAKWAFSKYMDPEVKVEDSKVDDAMMTIVAMEEGPEFEYSEAELREFAQKLIAGEVA